MNNIYIITDSLKIDHAFLSLKEAYEQAYEHRFEWFNWYSDDEQELTVFCRDKDYDKKIEIFIQWLQEEGDYRICQYTEKLLNSIGYYKR